MHPTDGRITQEVFNPNQASGQAFPHTGRDYSGNRGDTIRTIADGVVLHVTRENEPVPGWLANRFMLVPGSMAGGNSLFIQHDGWVEYFGHMENITVTVGERVHRGQSVGGVGDSGNAFGCHLHYEVIAEPCPASFPWGRYHPQDQIDYEDARGGAASILPTGNTKQEEEIVPNQNDRVFDAIDGSKVTLNELLNSIDRKSTAALQAVSSILATRIPDPTDPKKTYSIADYIVGGATNAKYAAGNSGTAMQNTSPEALAKAVQEGAATVSAKDVADRLTIGIKE